MREIKFRVWDKKIKKFRIGDVQISANGRAFAIHPNQKEIHNIIEYLDDVSVLQFTTLKDKSGVEVYEGDILESDNDDGIIVNWSKKFAGWQCKNLHNELLVNNDLKNYLVIGNIYENPELLKNKVEL